MLKDHFSRIVLLSLPYRPERAEAAIQQMETAGIARRGDLTLTCAFSGDWGPPPAWFKAGNGAWGCLMSHVRAVQDALMDGVERLLILEDDVWFHPDSPAWLERLMNGLPDQWDQLYLGGQHLKEPTGMLPDRFVTRAKNVNRTHAYALQRRVYAKFLQHVQHAPDYIARGAWHIDHQLGIAHERADWLVYAPAWWLCAQDEGSSNISGRQNPRLWWQPFPYARHLPFIQLPTTPPASREQEMRAHLHPGANLQPGTWQDIGLTEAVKEETTLLGWLETIAREALDTWRLPAWQHPDLTAERVRRVWPGGVIDLADADLPALTAYPENRLFPHPLTESARPIPAATVSAA